MSNVNYISKVYLLGVPLENDYKNTLYFANAQAQQTYFQSKIKKSYTDFSYQRKDKYIAVPSGYDEIAKCNYVMYQNSNYSNKWYYAFITKLEYINEEVTHVYIETDVLQTWLFDYTLKSSFVEREHVNNDTIGLHTVPENLELGEYINQEVPLAEEVGINFLYESGTHKNYVVLAVTEIGIDSTIGGTNYNGVFGGLIYLVFPTFSDAYSYILEIRRVKSDEIIQSAFMVPYDIGIDGDDFQWYTYTEGTFQFQFGFIQENNRPTELRFIQISKPSVLDKNYTPRNNKLLTYPYRFFNVSNNSGAVANYMYEYFTAINGSATNTCDFSILGAIGVGCSIKLVPLHYKQGNTGLNTAKENWLESLDAGKLPTCTWVNDVYTNWLTQNAVNIPLNIIENGAKLVGGAVTGNVASFGSGLGGITGTLAQVYEHSLAPNTAKGGVNQGDLVFSDKRSFTIYKMSIKEEYAKIIDGYFDMFGYKVNTVKVPNSNHRQRWWYTKTIDVNIDGDIPQDDMQKIKDAYNKGITFWKNASEIENYSLSNNIVS